MPLAANPLFTGRDAELRALAAIFKPAYDDSSGRRVCAAITGIPGSGKTQLSSEFVHRYGQFFLGGIYWIAFADPSAIATEIAACGMTGWMDLRPDFMTLPLEDRTRLVMSAWQSKLPRLLVFDNCEDERVLTGWLPPSGGSRVLVSTRRQQWDPALGISVTALESLARVESITLLRNYRPDLDQDDSAVAGVAAELGDLPLALHLAGSYLWRYRKAMTARMYLAELRRQDLLLHKSLAEGGTSPTGHEAGVARSFSVSYDQLDPAAATDALAADLLARAAHLAPGEVIPRSLLAPSIQGAVTSENEEEVASALAAEDALARLVELGLLQLAPDGGVRLHRLLGAFVRELADVAGAREAIADQLVTTCAEFERTGNLMRALDLEPHLRAVTDQALERPPEHQTRELCRTLGGLLRTSGNEAEAVLYLQRGLECAVAILGEENPELARDLNDLGLALLRHGDLAAARECLETALPRWQQLNDQPNHAATLDNLGQLAFAEGDLGEAAALFSDALKIREAVLDPFDPRIAVTLTNIGQLLVKKGDPKGALDYYRRALTLRLRTLGPLNASTAITLFSEADALRRTGDADGARESLGRAVDAYKASLGETNPRTLRAMTALAFAAADAGDRESSDDLLAQVEVNRARLIEMPTAAGADALNNIGFLHWSRGDFLSACAAYLDALRLCEGLKGTDHPDLVTILNNLGMVWAWLEDAPAARDAYERALHISVRSGSQATELAARVNHNYGVMLLSEGELPMARARLEQAHADRIRLLGDNHPETALTLSKIGILLSAEEQAVRGCSLTEHAVSIVRETPDERNMLAHCLHDNGVVLHGAHVLDSASASLTEALHIREAVLNPLHPDTARTLTELADVTSRLGDSSTALRYLDKAAAICEARLGKRPGGERFEHHLTLRVQTTRARLEADAAPDRYTATHPSAGPRARAKGCQTPTEG